MSGQLSNSTEISALFAIGLINSSFSNFNFSEINVNTDPDSDFGSDGSMKLSKALLSSFTACLTLLVIIGLIGNTVVIFALVRTRAHRATTTNAYILNLSIADLLFLIFCVPFQGTVYILNDWPFREFMCKAAHFCQYCTMYASIWVLTIMSVDRYMAIGHPLKSVDWRSPGQAMRICGYVWLVAALISIPWWLLYRTVQMSYRSVVVTACFDYWTDDMYEYRKWLFLIVFLTGFVLPSVIIFCMSLLVARSIKNAVDEPLLLANERRSQNSSSLRQSGSNFGGNVISKKRRRVVWLVFGLAFTFFLCWLPQNASFMWLNFYGDIVTSVQRHYKIYFIIKVASHMLTYVNSSINPILYSLASGRFRSRLAQALFLRNAGSVNRKRTISRPRTTPANRTTATNGTAGAVADPKSVGSESGAVGGCADNRPTIYVHATNFSGTDEDLASRNHSGEASPNPYPNQLSVPVFAAQAGIGLSNGSNNLELSRIANLKIASIGPTANGRSLDTIRSCALTRSTTLSDTALGSNTERDLGFSDADNLNREHREVVDRAKRSPKNCFFGKSKTTI